MACARRSPPTGVVLFSISRVVPSMASTGQARSQSPVSFRIGGERRAGFRSAPEPSAHPQVSVGVIRVDLVGKQILVVEDDAFIAFDLKLTLEAAVRLSSGRERALLTRCYSLKSRGRTLPCLMCA